VRAATLMRSEPTGTPLRGGVPSDLFFLIEEYHIPDSRVTVSLRTRDGEAAVESLIRMADSHGVDRTELLRDTIVALAEGRRVVERRVGAYALTFTTPLSVHRQSRKGTI
jgi:hypothetical protein